MANDSSERRVRTSWDWRAWVILTVGGGGLTGIGLVASLLIGVSAGIWFEGGDPFREFIYANAVSGKFTFVRGLGLILGGALVLLS